MSCDVPGERSESGGVVVDGNADHRRPRVKEPVGPQVKEPVGVVEHSKFAEAAGGTSWVDSTAESVGREEATARASVANSLLGGDQLGPSPEVGNAACVTLSPAANARSVTLLGPSDGETRSHGAGRAEAVRH